MCKSKTVLINIYLFLVFRIVIIYICSFSRDVYLKKVTIISQNFTFSRVNYNI